MIGIFDSGLGGLTVVQDIKENLPNCPIIYYGDTARYPWGDKSIDTVKRYTDEITRFLIDQGATIVVIACNTASTFSGSYLRARFPEMRFYDVISPVVKRIDQERRLHEEKHPRDQYKVGIIGTRATISTGVYQEQIKALSRHIQVNSKACPLFVPFFVQKGIVAPCFERSQNIFKGKTSDIYFLSCSNVLTQFE